MKHPLKRLATAATMATLVGSFGAAHASSHMDAPLITLDPAANTTDVYAFVRQDAAGGKRLYVALGVYPFEEPGIGPNKYNFDDNVLYEIHVALGDDVAAGRPTLSYQFQFDTEFRNVDTILQSFTDVITTVGDPGQNLLQRYSVTRLDHRAGGKPDKRGKRSYRRRHGSVLADGLLVPPNNQGIVTPLYNRFDDGEQPARDGVAAESALDGYTRDTVYELPDGHRVFAGQREDGFYADIQAVFDGLSLRSDAEDAQGGFNVHMIALEIPVAELGGDGQQVGVYATTSRRRVAVLSTKPERKDDRLKGDFVQVGRQGNPLFNEALVAIADKDLYNRTSPERDTDLFARYAESPELCRLINALGLLPSTSFEPCIETGRSDLAGIYIPDVIKVDLSTPGARLAGSGPDHPANPDDDGFSRLGVFGGDVLQSAIQDPFGNGGFIPGGWPNGRRFGDDVLDIALTAVVSDLRSLPLFVQGPIGDGVSENDIGYNKVFPYAGTPLNGRRHAHHGEPQDAL